MLSTEDSMLIASQAIPIYWRLPVDSFRSNGDIASKVSAIYWRWYDDSYKSIANQHAIYWKWHADTEYGMLIAIYFMKMACYIIAIKAIDIYWR